MKHYIINDSGSNGNIHDFSRVSVVDENALKNIYAHLTEGEREFEYVGFDSRINFHKWRYIGTIDGNKCQLLWVYSTFENVPYYCGSDE